MNKSIFNNIPKAFIEMRAYKLFILTLLILFTACASSESLSVVSPKESVIRYACLPPLEPFAYNSQKGPTQPPTLPSSPWEDIAPLAIPSETAIGTLYEIQHISSSEIWVQRNWIERNDEDKTLSDYVLYNFKSGVWRIIPAQVENGGVYVDQIYEDNNGNIWGRNIVYITSSAKKPKTILSKFDPIVERFVPQNQLENIPTQYNTEDSQFLGSEFANEVVLDANNSKFFVIAHNDAIYEFDLLSEKVMKLVDIPGIFAINPIVSPAGEIYLLNHFINYAPNNYIERMDLYKFTPETTQISRLPVNLDARGAFFLNVFIDRQERLWMDSVGWMESDGSTYGAWYQIQRSPLFTFSIRESGNDYRWRPARVMFQSSDNTLWFRHENGTFSLDPEKGEWCWFTTYQSNIVEDSDRNLWMIADNKLYKLPLGE
jgi:hypothetical protein